MTAAAVGFCFGVIIIVMVAWWLVGGLASIIRRYRWNTLTLLFSPMLLIVNLAIQLILVLGSCARDVCAVWGVDD